MSAQFSPKPNIVRRYFPPSEAARGSDNLMPLFVTCVEADITLGEICGVLRGVFGEYRPQVSI